MLGQVWQPVNNMLTQFMLSFSGNQGQAQQSLDCQAYIHFKSGHRYIQCFGTMSGRINSGTHNKTAYVTLFTAATELNHIGKLESNQYKVRCLGCDINFIVLSGGGGDVTNARDRLKGLLQELLDQSDDSSLSSHDDPSQSDLFNQQMAIKKPLPIKS
jgi:hypothetical protein